MPSNYGRLATPADRHRMGESRRVKILLGIIIFLLLILLFQHKNQRNQGRQGMTIEDKQFVELWSAKTQANTVYAITPTYARPVQKAELSRISQVVKLSPNIHWIIVEDAAKPSALVDTLIKRANLEHRTTILYQSTPTDFKQKIPNYQLPRGVSQRNAALDWIRSHAGERPNPSDNAVVFFMDDDNTYTEELFVEMGKIERGRVGVWPVGLVGGLMVEKPVLNATDHVTGFNAQWRPERPFPVDMAGFGISLDLLLANPEAKFSYNVERGYQESEILRHVTTLDRLQPMANKCTEVLVWHTRTELPKLTSEEALNKKKIYSDKGMEVGR